MNPNENAPGSNPDLSKDQIPTIEDEKEKLSESELFVHKRLEETKPGKNQFKWMFWAPEHITSWRRAKEFLFWMPTKRDMLKVLEIAKLVHKDEKTPIRILDIGGAGGFVDKLLVDLAREQGLVLETVVLDPAKDVLDEASEYYKSKGEDRIDFKIGTLAEHPELLKQKFDVVFNSWMWGNISQDIQQIDAPARVYVADTGGSTGYEEHYLPEPGFQDFGSWPVRDHGSIEDGGWYYAHTSCQIAVQLSDDTLATKEKEMQARLESLDAKPKTDVAGYVWEQDLERSFDAFIAREPFIQPGLSKKEARRELEYARIRIAHAKKNREIEWWKFRRETRWPSED